MKARGAGLPMSCGQRACRDRHGPGPVRRGPASSGATMLLGMHFGIGRIGRLRRRYRAALRAPIVPRKE